MEESTASSGKLTPPGLNTRSASSSKGCKQSSQIEPALSHTAGSPAKKKMKPSAPTDVFKTITAGASKEIGIQFSKYAKVLCDQAAVDASRMKELEGILAEARDLESCLKEKKLHLRQMLAVISDNLED